MLPEERALLSASETLRAYVDLTKPRITFLVVLTTIAGFCLASAHGLDWLNLVHLIVGISLLSSGISTLNQWMERDLDALMLRTRNRPLPTGKMSPTQALKFGLSLTLGAIVYVLFFINGLTALLGAITAASYLLLYTPLKTRTTLSTVWGAFPGAMPPLVGWVAVRGQLNIEGWVLFAILFLWQFPHFLAIAWMYRDDYARAGIKMLPVVEPEGRITSQQIVLYTVMLLPVSLLPTLVQVSGWVYFGGAIILGLGFLYFSILAALRRTTWQARRLLLASVIYLPLLFALMVLNH
ncbi:MAG: protoheme IX farnesyltransferase [Acidobacteria bacterium]|nr:protoheme IX farnesyltransferase [Acidobacteriota bacterium]